MGQASLNLILSSLILSRPSLVACHCIRHSTTSTSHVPSTFRHQNACRLIQGTTTSAQRNPSGDRRILCTHGRCLRRAASWCVCAFNSSTVPPLTSTTSARFRLASTDICAAMRASAAWRLIAGSRASRRASCASAARDTTTRGRVKRSHPVSNSSGISTICVVGGGAAQWQRNGPRARNAADRRRVPLLAYYDQVHSASTSSRRQGRLETRTAASIWPSAFVPLLARRPAGPGLLHPVPSQHTLTPSASPATPSTGGLPSLLRPKQTNAPHEPCTAHHNRLEREPVPEQVP